jgi:hypothetical protein
VGFDVPSLATIYKKIVLVGRGQLLLGVAKGNHRLNMPLNLVRQRSLITQERIY